MRRNLNAAELEALEMRKLKKDARVEAGENDAAFSISHCCFTVALHPNRDTKIPPSALMIYF